MPPVVTLLDILAILAALVAAWLWHAAGRRPVRRIVRSEVPDAADINRLVIAINRSAVLNRRADLATAVSAACVGLRFLASPAA
jgi:hypothetical protein